jgi:hypothetical protein
MYRGNCIFDTFYEVIDHASQNGNESQHVLISLLNLFLDVGFGQPQFYKCSLVAIKNLALVQSKYRL